MFHPSATYEYASHDFVCIYIYICVIASLLVIMCCHFAFCFFLFVSKEATLYLPTDSCSTLAQLPAIQCSTKYKLRICTNQLFTTIYLKFPTYTHTHIHTHIYKSSQAATARLLPSLIRCSPLLFACTFKWQNSHFYVYVVGVYAFS